MTASDAPDTTGAAPDVRATLRRCLAVERWVDEVAAKAPYPSLDELVLAADAASAELTEAEVDEALAEHPRIGEPPAADVDGPSSFSLREQEFPDADDEETSLAIARGNAVYEERFGRVFLIRASGRSRADILDELQRRLVLDEESELREAAEQLREITLLRVTQVGADPSTGLVAASSGGPR